MQAADLAPRRAKVGQGSGLAGGDLAAQGAGPKERVSVQTGSYRDKEARPKPRSPRAPPLGKPGCLGLDLGLRELVDLCSGPSPPVGCASSGDMVSLSMLAISPALPAASL